MASAFKQSQYARSLDSTLSEPHGDTNSRQALATSKFAVSKLSLFRACFARELILISRNRFLYTFRTCQVRSCVSLLHLLQFLTNELMADPSHIQYHCIESLFNFLLFVLLIYEKISSSIKDDMRTYSVSSKMSVSSGPGIEIMLKQIIQLLDPSLW